MKIEECVERGAEWLDRNISDWAHRINTNYLDMAECSSCVLGQVIRDFVLARDLYSWCEFHLPEDGTGEQNAEYSGFDLSGEQSVDYSYDDLAKLWINEIKERIS